MLESLTAANLFLLCPWGRSEWGVNQHRDSLALYVGFDSLTQYIAVAENESVGRVKFNCLQVSDVLASLPQPRPRATLCSRRASARAQAKPWLTPRYPLRLTSRRK